MIDLIAVIPCRTVNCGQFQLASIVPVVLQTTQQTLLGCHNKALPVKINVLRMSYVFIFYLIENFHSLFLSALVIRFLTVSLNLLKL